MRHRRLDNGLSGDNTRRFFNVSIETERERERSRIKLLQAVYDFVQGVRMPL